MTGQSVSDAGVARASALLEVGRVDAARREVAAVLADDPDNVDALYVLARSYQAQDGFVAMQEAAARAVAVAPGGFEGHLLLAFAQLGVGDPAAARASALEAVRLEPEDWRGYAALSLASLDLGQSRRAFRASARAVALAPESAGPHYIQALMFQSIGWNLLAKRSYRRVLALDPEHNAAVTGLGRIAVTRGRLSAAAGHISAVMAVEPTNRAARTELDRLLIGGFGGWALMSVWTAGFVGMFAGLPWMWVLALLPPSLWLLWAARTWRALSPGARAYATYVLRADVRARGRLFGLVLCVLTATLLVVAGLRQDPDRPPSVAMAGMVVTHFLALMVSGAVIVIADRKVAGPPSATGPGMFPQGVSPAGVRSVGVPGSAAATSAQQANTDLLAVHREASYAGRWAMRLARAGALFAVAPLLLSVDPPAPWASRAVVGSIALAGFVGYAAWSRRRIILRPQRQNVALGLLLVPLTLATLVEFLAIALAAVLPPSAMPLSDLVAVPAFVAVCAGMVAWLGWLLHAGARILVRLRHSRRRQGALW
ncbi:hypothetical protein ACFO0M_27660 [Micromonospora mangrovi]|uniref:Tetratricopeptide repeat protein n=2 Tax=Micromonospora TaxID=1873 RepID=A0AAU7MDZ8_9ACTN